MGQLRITKKVVISLLIIVLLSLLGGCVGQRELNNLGIINLMGIDLMNNGNYKITIHIMKPSTGQGGQPANAPGPGSAIWVGESKGATIQEAVKNLRAKTSWLLIWSHCDTFVVGNKLCKSGIKNVVDFLARNEEIRLTSNLVTAANEAWRILKHSPEEKKEPVADQIDGLITNIMDWSKAYNLTLKEVMSRLASGGQEIVLGKLELVPAKPVKEGQEDPSSGSGQKGNQDKLKYVLKMAGAAVFKQDKLVGYLTSLETRGYLRIINEIKLHSSNVVLPEYNNPVSVDTYDSKTQINWNANTPKTFLIKVKESCRLAEQNLGISQTSVVTTNKLEKAKEKVVKEEIKLAIKKAQQLQSDIFGCKGIIMRSDPAQWKKLKDNWGINFNELTFNIKVESSLKQVGKIHKPIF